MILDKLLTFGSDDAIAAITSTAAAADYVCDMGTKKTHLFPLTHSSTSSIGSPDYGEGGDIWFNALVTTALKASSSATFTVALVTHSTSASIAASGTTLLTHTTAALSSTSTTSSADAGDYLIRAKIPAGAKRYLACVYTASADKMASGNISSWLGYTATNI